MRLPRAVARVALIVALALVAAPGDVGSRVPSPQSSMDPAHFHEVAIPPAGPLATTHFEPDTVSQSDGRLDGPGLLVEPEAALDDPSALAEMDPGNPGVALPDVTPGEVDIAQWRRSQASFYGPGFYGKGLFCPGILTTDLLGVAHRTLPCGALVTFKNPANGRILTVPVVDRGPYVAGREFDLTGGACLALDFCYTGIIYWHLGPA